MLRDAFLVEEGGEATVEVGIAGRGSASAARHPPMVAPMTRHCARCGSAGDSPEDGLPEGWSLDVGDGRVSYLCGDCTRANVRAIEAKLPQEWWE